MSKVTFIHSLWTYLLWHQFTTPVYKFSLPHAYKPYLKCNVFGSDVGPYIVSVFDTCGREIITPLHGVVIGLSFERTYTNVFNYETQFNFEILMKNQGDSIYFYIQ